jgi:Kdo2-lipid IVA lauroyltransferase/acyltransferase
VTTTTDPSAGRDEAGLPKPGLLAWLEYAGFRLVAALFRALPLDLSSKVSGMLWRGIAPHLGRHERALRNIAAAMPELSEAERQAAILEMWEMLGRTFAEALRIDEILDDPGRVHVELTPEVEAVLNAEKGVVLVSLHMSNWELAAPSMRHIGVPVAGVYQHIKNRLVDRYVTAMRRPHYPLGLFGKGHGSVAAMMRVLRAGGAIAVLADLREHTGVRVPFFGREAPSSPFPALLARGRGVPLVAGQVRRIGPCRFHISCVIIPVPRTEDRQADILAATASIHATFESWIRETPGQWMWAHRRWG